MLGFLWEELPSFVVRASPSPAVINSIRNISVVYFQPAFAANASGESSVHVFVWLERYTRLGLRLNFHFYI